MSDQRGRVLDQTRYEFGKNWKRFLTVLNASRIEAAERSLRDMLTVPDLAGKSFLDIGSGSGLFSLAARRLGARVHSFDYDSGSVACTSELKERFFPGDTRWTIDRGSVLDTAYLSSLGRFNVVYAWGVLHHTGAMWHALENVLIPLEDEGRLFIALYNDQGYLSTYWRGVKRLYSKHPKARLLIACTHAPLLVFTRLLPWLLRGRRRSERGMSLWHDLDDWLGGYPFEVASRDAVIDFYRERGYVLANFRPRGDPSGNNEFVFVRGNPAHPAGLPA